MSRFLVMLASLLALTGGAAAQAPGSTMRSGGMTIQRGAFTSTTQRTEGMKMVRDSNRAVADIGFAFEAGSSESTADTSGSPAFDVTLRGTLFFRRVVDDGTPRSLQPFLQRVGGFTLGVNVGIATASFSNVPGDETRSFHQVGLRAAADVYLTHFLAVAVSGGYTVVDANLAERRAASARATVGLRFGTLRLDLGADLKLNAESARGYEVAGRPIMTNPSRADGRARLDLHVVLLEHIELQLGATVGPIAADGYFLATYYAGWRLGLQWGLGGGGTFDPTRAHHTRTLNLHVGMSLWLTRGWNATLQFVPAWSNSDVGGTFDQRLIITIVARIG